MEQIKGSGCGGIGMVKSICIARKGRGGGGLQRDKGKENAVGGRIKIL